MPYERDTQTRPHRFILWPHQSMTPAGFAWFFSGTAAFISLPLIAVLGTPVLWGLLPFLAGTMALLWAMIMRNRRDAQLREDLTLWPDRVELIRTNPRGPAQEWDANPYWVRVNIHADAGPVPNYLTLSGGDREIEIGAFLSADERLALYDDLTHAFDAARNAGRAAP